MFTLNSPYIRIIILWLRDFWVCLTVHTVAPTLLDIFVTRIWLFFGVAHPYMGGKLYDLNSKLIMSFEISTFRKSLETIIDCSFVSPFQIGMHSFFVWAVLSYLEDGDFRPPKTFELRRGISMVRVAPLSRIFLVFTLFRPIYIATISH